MQGPKRKVRISSTQSLDYPILAVAPMVGQCDLPFRELTRRYRATLVYTEMLKAEALCEDERYRRDAGLDMDSGPLLVQVCTRSPEAFAGAAMVAKAAGAVGLDLNLGCPQSRAKDGGYGAYLAEEDWDLCEAIVRHGREAVGQDFAISVKLRIQRDGPHATVAFAKKLVAAGASLVALHARYRGRTDARRDGAAYLDVVKLLVDALDVPVLSNGNVRSANDVRENLRSTGAAGVLVAEEILRYPALFRDVLTISEPPTPHQRADLIREYLDLCHDLELRGLKRDDRSTKVKHGNLARAPSAPNDGPRYSNWWPNIECVRQHCRRMLDDSPLDPHRVSLKFIDVFQRNIFRKAVSVLQIDAYLRKRLNLRPRPLDGDPPEEDYEDDDDLGALFCHS